MVGLCLCVGVFGKTVVGGVPTMQVEEWLACELVPVVVDGHLVLDVVLLDVVEMLNAG